MVVKTQITVQKDLLLKIDKYVKENSMTRSGFISFVCRKYLTEIDMQQAILNLSETMRALSDDSNNADFKRDLRAFNENLDLILQRSDEEYGNGN